MGLYRDDVSTCFSIQEMRRSDSTSSAKSRREGKNRRDNATVSTRVLRLADMMGRELYDTATNPLSDADGSAKRPPERAVQAVPRL